MELLELGVMVKDTISKTDGMLTHAIINSETYIEYLYQPKSLNPKNGKPADLVFVSGERIEGKKETIDVPLDYIGTKAEDIATGFKGKIVGLVYHLGGCLHIKIKPEGLSKETGSTYESHEFDVRRVKGQKIKPLKAEEAKKSKKLVPSPTPYLSKSS